MSHNLPPFVSTGIFPTELRNKWLQWKRASHYVIIAENIKDGNIKKSKLLAMGGFDLQDIFYAIPDANVDKVIQVRNIKKTPYEVAIEKLDEPEHHATYERMLNWTLKSEQVNLCFAFSWSFTNR